MLYTLEKEVLLNTSISECWEFLRNPDNLNEITPPDLHFKIVSRVPEQMYNGLLIEYSIRIPGIGTQHWVTEIRHILEQRSFVDEQRCGPFRFWHHYHEIEQVENGVISRDRVNYVMPFGIIGRTLHTLTIRKTLQRIFKYREEQLHRLFPL